MATETHLAASRSNRCEGDFLGARHDRNEQRTWWVVWLTAAMMVGEILGGTFFGSMALVADGWHMATHAAALTIAGLAYSYARKHRDDPRFAFGTGKVGELAGFASAVTLGIVALLIAWESVMRLVNPHVIRFDQAIAVAALGLAVNLASARLLHDDHAQGAEHDHDHGGDPDHDHHRHHGRDSNLYAAYLHVIADAVTSVLAIGGLVAGRLFGWVWLDPAIGIVGAVVIAYWSWNLVRSAAHELLDVSANPKLLAAIAARLESESETITDLHLWRVGPGHSALIVSLTSSQPASPDSYKAKLQGLRGLSHVTIEVNHRQ